MQSAGGKSPSSFACWKRGGGRQKRRSDAQLLTLIRAIHAETRGAYGSPRVFRELKVRGVAVGRERVVRLMRRHDIRARHKRRCNATTDSRHDSPATPNLLDRNFEPNCPDQTWTADITFIPTAEGWLYLAVVIELYTRMVVGWAMDARMTRELVISALRMAYFRRRPKSGLIHHSNRGSQYCSVDYQALLHQYGMRVSMSRKGNCWDNAPTDPPLQVQNWPHVCLVVAICRGGLAAGFREPEKQRRSPPLAESAPRGCVTSSSPLS